MAKNNNIYKFDVIEKVISECSCNSKEEVLDLVNKMRDIAVDNKSYSNEVKNAFIDAATEIKNELTLENIKEIKKIINGTKE